MIGPVGTVGQERRTGAGPGIACVVGGIGSAVARRTGLGHVAVGVVIVGFAVVTVGFAVVTVGFAVVTVAVGMVIRIRQRHHAMGDGPGSLAQSALERGLDGPGARATDLEGRQPPFTAPGPFHQ
ncbi:hypothetical protein GCM10023083_57150 [Streptomyces phyllanthi]